VDARGRITMKTFFASLFDHINKDVEMIHHEMYLNDDSWMAQAGGEKNNDETVDPNHNSSEGSQ
ncbi:hypothetical protein PENTCL1PPCAC_7372, partial [Pristionchus entomophagus]